MQLNSNNFPNGSCRFVQYKLWVTWYGLDYRVTNRQNWFDSWQGQAFIHSSKRQICAGDHPDSSGIRGFFLGKGRVGWGNRIASKDNYSYRSTIKVTMTGANNPLPCAFRAWTTTMLHLLIPHIGGNGFFGSLKRKQKIYRLVYTFTSILVPK
jgi:hypothetical protein